MTQLLIVCTGNICRSPMAQVIAQKLATGVRLVVPLTVDSAGTHTAPVAERLDPRARAALVRHGYEAGHRCSRQVSLQDFRNFDLILAMDSHNLADLQRLCPLEHLHKLRFFLSFSTALSEAVVPDPYYGSAQGFDNVIRLCEAGARGLLMHLASASF